MSALLPPFDPTQKYGLWGYSGAMCDRAIRADNAPLLSECVDRGFVDIDTRMVAGTVIEYCDKHAPKCAAMLRERAVESRLIPPAAAGNPDIARSDEQA